MSLQIVDVGVPASNDSHKAFLKKIKFGRATPYFEILFGNISKDDNKISFYTGFPNYAALKM